MYHFEETQSKTQIVHHHALHYIISSSAVFRIVYAFKTIAQIANFLGAITVYQTATSLARDSSK